MMMPPAPDPVASPTGKACQVNKLIQFQVPGQRLRSFAQVLFIYYYYNSI